MPRVFRHIQPSNSDSYASDKSPIPPKFTYNDISHNNVRLYGTLMLLVSTNWVVASIYQIKFITEQVLTVITLELFGLVSLK